MPWQEDQNVIAKASAKNIFQLISLDFTTLIQLDSKCVFLALLVLCMVIKQACGGRLSSS